MKVLWFINNPVPEMLHFSNAGNARGGHWLSQLLNHVAKLEGLELGVVSAYPGLRDGCFTENNVRFFTMSQPRRFSPFALRNKDLDKCIAIIDDFKPDLIHVHGSERFYGLVKQRGGLDIPLVLSIQGLLGSCSVGVQFFGELSPVEFLRSLRLLELPVRLGLAWQYYDIKKGARRELKILSAADGFLGRTTWDKAHTNTINPGAPYYHVGEILRPIFYQSQWNLGACERHTLIYTNAGHPRRGTEGLLSAVATLKYEFPDIRLKLAGNISARSGYGRFLRKRIENLGIGDRVELLGYLDDRDMVHALRQAHVFVITSYVENSPNSLAEAMLIGMPCVASYVGGIPDMVKHDETGLLYPAGDVPLLVDRIRSLFRDDAFSTRLAVGARRVAHDRHDPQTVVEQLHAAYKDMLLVG